MEIVITHNNMDFDALAAQFGVTKLYPAAKMVLGYPLVGNVRDFLALYRSSLPIAQSKYIDLDEVKRIYVVDCQHFERIDSNVQRFLKGKQKEIWPAITVFDHHDLDKKGLAVNATSDSVIKPVGSATTIVVERIMKESVSLTPFEATVLALGIYEDTGCLTHKGTSELDAQSVAFLLAKGADLEQVNNYIRPKLSIEQTELLENLLANSEIESYEGAKVVTSVASTEHYVDGLANMTRKLIEILSAQAAFCAVHMRDRIHLVGRSENKSINVREIVRAFGGDGHPGAGSAVIKDRDGASVIELVKETIESRVEPQPTASQMMTSPVRTILPTLKMEEAGRLMTRYGVDGFVVSDRNEVVGVVSRRDIDQAMHHKLGHAPVRGFMSKPVFTVKKDTPLVEIQHLMVTEDIGRLPVLDSDGRLVGLVTRQNVLDTLYGTYSRNKGEGRLEDTIEVDVLVPEAKHRQRIEAIKNKFENLEPSTLWLCRTIGEVAARKGMVAYAVGGLVRDLILGRQNFDLDFVVEGSARDLAQSFEQDYPARFEVVATHERFNTATIIYHAETDKEVDLSTARTEFYEFPAALPTVEPSKLEQDLYRRDFTINTLAVCLNPGRFGELTDLFDGLKDLNNRVIRILHPFSFIEDPTRIVRAARFASRLAFRLSLKTRDKAREAVAMGIFDNLGGVRLREEIKMILESPERIVALDVLEDLGGCLRFLASGLTYNEHCRNLIRLAERLLMRYQVKDPWIVYLGLLLSGVELEELDDVFERLHLSNLHRDIIRAGLSVHRKVGNTRQSWKRSQIYQVFKGSKEESLAIAACMAEPGTQVRRMILLYINELLDVKISLTGNQLVELGVPRGPRIGEILEQVHIAKLDGEIKTEQEEKRYVSALIGS
ncbi:CBS domain-containing protein [bacterium]|nr:CBS domain-containing protein [bacterium]